MVFKYFSNYARRAAYIQIHRKFKHGERFLHNFRREKKSRNAILIKSSQKCIIISVLQDDLNENLMKIK